MAKNSGIILYGLRLTTTHVSGQIDAAEFGNLESNNKKFELQNYSLETLVPSWRFADFLFGYGQRPNPHHMSTIKIRQHGFNDCVDTEESMLELLRQMQKEKIIPE